MNRIRRWGQRVDVERRTSTRTVPIRRLEKVGGCYVRTTKEWTK